MIVSKLSKGKFRKLTYISILSIVIGMFLLLLSIQLYLDWKKINSGNEGYAIVNKPVNILNTLGFDSGFNEREIKELESQSFINKVGVFSSNDFRVSLGSNRLGFRTEAFFESVPDDFVDVEYYRWSKYEDGDEIPIILSADYLALYNFGFAPSQGLPQFTAGTIGMVKLDVDIFGNNRVPGKYKAKIIGFSKRLNSIIVPKSFLDYANAKHGSNASENVSRLILEIENPNAADFIEYISDKGYELNVNTAFGKETSILIKRAILLITIIGLLVLILSVLVLYLSYRLIIEENVEKIKTLYTLGYHPKSMAAAFSKQAISIIVISVVSATIILQVFHYYIAKQINGIGFEINGWLHPITFIISIVILIGLIFLGKFFVNKTMKNKYV